MPGQADVISCAMFMLTADLLEAAGGELDDKSFGQADIATFRQLFWGAISAGQLAMPKATVQPLPAAFSHFISFHQYISHCQQVDRTAQFCLWINVQNYNWHNRISLSLCNKICTIPKIVSMNKTAIGTSRKLTPVTDTGTWNIFILLFVHAQRIIRWKIRDIHAKTVFYC